MSTSHLVFTKQIEGSSETIFDLIADMPNYGRWLPGSEAFAATTQVSPYPVRLGTTYVDGGPAGVRRGSVTEYDPPQHIAFQQSMRLKKGPLSADIDIRIRYTLHAIQRITHVTRAVDLSIQIPGLLMAAETLVKWAFRRESLRILTELKRFVEGVPSP